MIIVVVVVHTLSLDRGFSHSSLMYWSVLSHHCYPLHRAKKNPPLRSVSIVGHPILPFQEMHIAWLHDGRNRFFLLTYCNNQSEMTFISFPISSFVQRLTQSVLNTLRYHSFFKSSDSLLIRLPLDASCTRINCIFEMTFIELKHYFFKKPTKILYVQYILLKK